MAGIPDAGAAEREARWALGLVPQLGGVALQALFAAFGSAVRAWEASPQALVAVPGISPAMAKGRRSMNRTCIGVFPPPSFFRHS
jgi:hypothetical protein